MTSGPSTGQGAWLPWFCPDVACGDVNSALEIPPHSTGWDEKGELSLDPRHSLVEHLPGAPVTSGLALGAAKQET